MYYNIIELELREFVFKEPLIMKTKPLQLND